MEVETNELIELIDQVAQWNVESGVPQEMYVIEECSELIKEVTKKSRNKGNHDNLIDEACDVIASTLVLLHENQIELDTIKNKISFKYNRAIERYKNGEL